MCGIAGHVRLSSRGTAIDESVVRRMTARLRHRGPDDEGTFVDTSVGFGMRRLAVIDVDGGRQPLFNEDRSVVVIFNGEIYNYRDLAEQLERSGHRLSSHSDGEVIAHLYEEHGAAFAERLDGMFAVALYDLQEGRVLLARDPVGIKPLFVWKSSHDLVFGSEIKALLEHEAVPRELDRDALVELLTWEYVPAPRTLFRAIEKVEPATVVTFDLATGSSSARRFWSLQKTGRSATHREWLERLGSELDGAVASQLVSDVPLGTFLSGGVDSSLIASAMARTARSTGAAAPGAYTIGFDEQGYDESRWAGRVARHLELEHTMRTLNPEVASLTDTLLEAMDDPIGDFSIFPTYLISRLAREEVTVALSGDGGDELFGGYDTFVAQSLASTWSGIPRLLRSPLERGLGSLRPRPQKKGWINKAKRFAEGAANPTDLGHSRWRLYLTAEQRAGLLTADLAHSLERDPFCHIRDLDARAPEGLDTLERALFIDFHSYLPDNCLVKVDRMSMLCSLEVRVPLLARSMVELAFDLPSRLKLKGTKTKILLKELAATRVPRAAVYRTKQGFSMPMKQWLNSSLAERLSDELAPSTLEAQGLFVPEAVARLVAEHRSGRVNHSHLLWSLLVFQDWRRRFRV